MYSSSSFFREVDPGMSRDSISLVHHHSLSNETSVAPSVADLVPTLSTPVAQVEFFAESLEVLRLSGVSLIGNAAANAFDPSELFLCGEPQHQLFSELGLLRQLYSSG